MKSKFPGLIFNGMPVTQNAAISKQQLSNQFQMDKSPSLPFFLFKKPFHSDITTGIKKDIQVLNLTSVNLHILLITAKI